MKNRLAKVALLTSLIYAVIGGVWILLSGQVLFALISDPAIRNRVEIYKGWAFVTVTAVLLYFVLRKQLQRIEQESMERRQAEEVLLTNQAKLMAALASMTDAVFITDVNGQFIEFNDAFATFYRFKNRRECAKNLADYPAILDVFMANGEPAPLAQWAVPRALRGETGSNVEYSLRRKDTGETWVGSYNFAPIRDKSGAIVGSVVVGRDITEHKQAEETIARERQLLRTLIDLLPETLYVKDSEGRFLIVNETLARHMGKETPAQTLGRSDADFYPPEMAAMFRAEELKVLGGEPLIDCEQTSISPDGQKGTHLTTKVPFRDSHGKVQGLVGIGRDITERKQMEETLARERSLLRTLIDNLPDCIYAKDAAGRKILANPADLKNYHCKTEAEAIGKTDFDLFPKDIAEKFHADDQKVIHGQPVINREEYFLNEEGARRWLLTSKLPLRDQNGEIVGLVGIGRDITERKQAEETIDRERQLLRTLIDLLPETFYVKDLNSRFLVANVALAKHFGVETPSQILGRSDADFFPPEPAAEYRAAELKVLSGEPLINYEGKGISPSGRECTHLTTKVPFRDSQGRIQGLVGVGRDITERQQTEEALRQSEEQLREVVRSTRCILNFGEVEAPEGWRERVMKEPRLFLWNFPVLNVEGAQEVYPLEVPPGKQYQDVWVENRHPDDFRQMHLVARDAFLHDKPFYRNEFRCTDKHGVEHWMQEFITIRKLGENRWQVFGINSDVTDLKKSESAVRASERKLRQLNRSLQALSKCNEALVRATDENNLLTKICQIITEIGGFRLAWVGYMEQDEAKSVRPVAWAGPETSYLNNLQVTWTDTERGHGPVGTAIRTGQPAIFSKLAEHPDFAPWREAALRHGFGSSIGLPLKADGKLFGVLTVYASQADAFNPTETTLLMELADDLAFGIAALRSRAQRKQLEEQLRQSQKMEAVGQLAGGVAHDFNNILTVIQGNASLLLNPQLDPKDKSGCSQQIVQAAERAASLTRQLLIFSRKQVMQPANVDWNEVVGNMTKMLRRVLGEDIVLQTNYAPNLPLIHADVGMLEQVLMNLMVNARDAMPTGGQLSIITRTEEFAKAQVEKNPDAVAGLHVCLTVSDTGCGIPKQNMPRIFEPFFTTKEVGKGTGLGLATVYSIIQQHHGWITVASEVKKGATFNIYFPAMKGERVGKEVNGAADKLPHGTGTILVVEDELAVRVLVSHLLQRCGYTVLQAETGVAALKIWQENQDKIQVLLTDIVMPDGMNGYELAQQLRAAKPKLKVIYTSGYSGEVVGKSLNLSEGANFLQKPYPPQKLLQILQDNLGHN